MSGLNLYKSFPAVLLMCIAVLKVIPSDNNGLIINKKEYFEMPGLNVMVFNDYYLLL